MTPLVPKVAVEFESYQAYVHLVVIVLTEFLHRLLDIIVIGVLEVVVDLFFLVRIYHLLDEVIDINLCSAENDNIKTAMEELGEDYYDEMHVRLVRLKFHCDLGN